MELTVGYQLNRTLIIELLFQILIGLLIPFVCFSIKFTADDAATETGASSQTETKKSIINDETDVTSANDVALTKFGEKNSKNGSMEPLDYVSSGERKKNKRKKLLTGNKFVYALYYFYTAPIVKFCYYVASRIHIFTVSLKKLPVKLCFKSNRTNSYIIGRVN